MMKNLYLSMVLLVPVLMFAQQDMQGQMTPDTTATMADTTAAVESMQEAAFDTTVFGEDQAPVDIEEYDYMVEEEGAKTMGITAGINVGYPVWSSGGMAAHNYGPQFGLIIGTPYGLDLGLINLGVGAEIGMFSFPAKPENAGKKDVTGIQVLATVNALLADTPYGPISAQIGGGYFGDGVGVTAGFSYDYQVPNLPVLVRGYLRANGSSNLSPEFGEPDDHSAGWINIGAMISYDMSGMF